MQKYLTYILLATSTIAISQPINDDCFSATAISSVDNYCSSNGEFSNSDSNPDPMIPNSCFIGFSNGVWFSFTPAEPAITAQIQSGGIAGNVENPKMALFTGPCNNLTLVSCSPGSSRFNDELTVAGLTIGLRYYLYVETSQTGRFRLCINDFIPPPSPESDCVDGVILCDKSGFQVESLTTAGQDITELDSLFPGQCLQEEFNSSWYRWTCDQPGSLTFTLTPNNYVPGEPSDDIDFALFELPNGIDDCFAKEMIRCMASGANGTIDLNGIFVQDPFEEWERCSGPTGLAINDGMTSEFPGCVDSGDNNFVDAINMEAGKSYALVVMNFSRTGLGFSIEFGGTGTFQGPSPSFEVIDLDGLNCDKKLEVVNTSLVSPDPIINYSWNFGVDATPPVEFGQGPFEIEYASIGSKSIILTVETLNGCVVSEIMNIEIEPCCENNSDLMVDATTTDVICFGDETGVISVQGSGGNPEYSYSINGGDFLPNTVFNGLAAGVYDIAITDTKGCTNTNAVTIDSPPPIEVTVSADVTINLGEETQLFGNYTPMSPGDIISWSPIEGLSCTDCLDPIALAPGTTTYVLTVIDEMGCEDQDSVTITTELVRPLYYPNVITPTSNDVNSVFTLEFGPQVELIEEFTVFDRWGNPIFKCDNIDPQDPIFEWDGRFGDCNGSFQDFVNPGVFVWVAQVRFIDNVTLPYIDDVTVLR
ncbi:MAG: hypothetical protein HKN51_12785 [Saprospiraceae bacterium]|nr:hypothetical protein [Saprospiraceae bacterium]